MKSPEELLNPLFQSIQDRSKQIGKDKHASIDDKNRIHPSRLEKVEEPPSAIELRKLIKNHMPQKLLSEMLAEVDRLTAFSSHLTRLSSGDPINLGETLFGRALYAAIRSGACNIPLTKLVAPGLTIDLLETAKEEIVRPQTLQAAIIALASRQHSSAPHYCFYFFAPSRLRVPSHSSKNPKTVPNRNAN